MHINNAYLCYAPTIVISSSRKGGGEDEALTSGSMTGVA